MTSATATPAQRERPALKLGVSVLIAASGVLLFGFAMPLAGYPVLAAALVAAWFVDRRMFRDLSLIAVGLVALSLVPINTSIDWSHMLQMGAALAVAVLTPYLLSRFVFRDHAIRFPVATGHRWTKLEWGYLIVVIGLGYAILPVYLIRSGIYQNWPAATTGDEVFRLFLGTNALGIWDELFFICTCFALLRRHLPDWQANLIQAALFTSFLWELGFRSFGPFIIFPFALVQGWTFTLTKSLSYIVTVHLLFDFVLFLVLLHSHNPSILQFFVY
ncbi:CPBP family glutamic-type intramembrane protease [Plantibacter sp. YIM 135347]|uniref:CPBP family glutamic-type intramembrane protease n=1 Tax=Plantibacter sp. YIM 135347 TaxID=3423919 RepID=UPI003D335F7F